MKTYRRFPITVGILSTLVLAACGGGTTTTGGPGGPGATSGGPATQAPGGATTQAPGGSETVNACALLTAEDIDDVTGLVASSMTPGPQAGIFMSGCEWALVDDDAMVPPTISLGVMTTGGKAYYDRYFRPFNEGAGYEAIEDLGDEAVDADFGAVMVVTGDAFFQVQYIGGTFGGDDSTAMATELARWVVINLGG